MGIQYEWDDPDKQDLMVFMIASPFSWEEYDAITDSVFVSLGQKPYPIATIVDVSNLHKLPPSNPLPHLQRVNQMMTKNVYASVVVGAARPVRLFMNVITGVYPHARGITWFAESMDAARTIIAKERP